MSTPVSATDRSSTPSPRVNPRRRAGHNAADGSGQFLARALAALVVGAVPASATAVAATNLTFKAELTLKETFDSNVYLQDVEPNPRVVGAAQPFQESFVTAVTPRVALEYKPMPEFNLAASYAPEVVTFHAEPSESHVAHRSALTFSGKVGRVTWEQFNTFNWIDGSETGLTFGGPGGAPAIGGIPIRDRREAIVYRNGFRAVHAHDPWFFRPAAASYIHDFRTETRSPLTDPFYQNYVDRDDFNVGLDAGYKALPNAYLVLGYRFGFQREPPLPGLSVDYSNDYNRLLFGLEGKLTDWLRVGAALGPDYRDFNHDTPPGFDDHHTKLYVDAVVTLIPTKEDSVAFTIKQYEQPAFGAPSAYEDITYDVAWRHKFSPRFTSALGFRAYGGDWLAPVNREDWIFTPSATLAVTLNRHFSGEVAYSYDWVDSLVPNTAGREFTRHLGTVGLKYTY